MSDPSNLLALDGKVALVTGAGQGVGESIAAFLAANGAAVAVNDFHAERAEAVAEAITASGGTAIGAQADVTDQASVHEMVATITDRLGAPTVLVNNAGNAGADPASAGRKPFWESEPENWEAFIGVNLYGVLHNCRAVIPGMIEAQHGRLITIISDAGRVGEANGLEVYSAAKAGAAGLMRGLARSLGRFNITANCIAISMTETPAIAPMLANEEMVKKALSNYIIRRVGQPSDIAAMATFLASDSSSWITGQTYPVNGGFSVNQ